MFIERILTIEIVIIRVSSSSYARVYGSVVCLIKYIFSPKSLVTDDQLCDQQTVLSRPCYFFVDIPSDHGLSLVYYENGSLKSLVVGIVNFFSRITRHVQSQVGYFVSCEQTNGSGLITHIINIALKYIKTLVGVRRSIIDKLPTRG